MPDPSNDPRPVPPDHTGLYPRQDDKADGGRVVTNRRHQAYDESRVRRDGFVLALTNGRTIRQACDDVGVGVAAYRKWRTRWPQFAGQVDMILAEQAHHEGPVDNRKWTSGFASFRLTFFGMTSPWFHLEVVDVLENAPAGSITLILLPPEHGKTTLLEDWCSMKLAVDPGHRIGYASEKQAHSVKALARVKARMEDDSRFRTYVARFGPFSPRTGEDRVKKVKGTQPWGATHFDVYKKGEHDERDYSMAALGIGAAVAGSRFDTLIIDDVQSLKTLNLSSKIVETIRQDWLSRPGSKGRTVIIGTRVGDDDVYQMLMDARRPDGSPLIHRIIVHPAVDHNGQGLWPERYSPEEYVLMEGNAGPEAWARNYQQRPRAKGMATFVEEKVRACQDPLRSWEMDPPGAPYQGMIAMLDPALGGQNSWGILAYSPDEVTVIDTVGDTGFTRVEQIFDRGAQLLQMWSGRGLPITHLIVEENTLQKGIKNDDRLKELERQYGFSIQGHQTQHNKMDPDIGVASMAMSFARREIVLPGSDDPMTKARFEPLIQELLKWRPVRGNKLKMDRVMCLWFGWLWWHQRKRTLGIPPEIQTPALPWAPTQRPSGLLVPSGMGYR